MRYEAYDLDSCPRCGQRHRFAIAIREKEALFGGTGDTEPAIQSVAFTCPVTMTLVTQQISAPDGSEIVGPADPSVLTAQAASDVDGDEFTQWVKDSRKTALDFCNTMLTTSTGAIPIYFAIMKYLGTEAAGSALVSRAGVLPPLLFLSAAATFVLALRPVFGYVDAEEFRAFRRRRLTAQDRYMRIGTALFGAGILLAIVLLFHNLVAGK